MNTNGCCVICTVMFMYIYILYVYLKGKNILKIFYLHLPNLILNIWN